MRITSAGVTMEKVKKLVGWLSKNFLLIVFAAFIAIYLRWYQLQPLRFDMYDDGAYLVGLVLFGSSALSAILWGLARKYGLLRAFLLVLTVLCLLVSSFHVLLFFPVTLLAGNCNGNRYYMTAGHPFSDLQWTVHRIAVWRNMFNYESVYISRLGGAERIVCDVKREEAHIVEDVGAVGLVRERLVYTDGADSRQYDDGARLADHQYGLGYDYNIDRDSYTYNLYRCNLDFTDCQRLPFAYTGEYGGSGGYLRTNEEDTELDVYFDAYHGTQWEPVRVFTFGETPKCYVDGCVFLEQE